MDNMLCEKLPDKVAEFYEAIGGLGNVYHLYTENEKGEITSEAFGKNVITDYGLLHIHTYYSQSANTTSGYKIWIGNSTEQPTLESSSMTSLVSNKSATRYADGLGEGLSYQTRYPGRFIPEKGLFVQNVKIAKQYFDYNIPDANGVTLIEPVTITEIGLGEKSTELVSHALIYNSNGQVSSIVKKPNEKLFVTIYWQGAVPIAYIENNWSKDIATFIEPAVFALPYREHIAWCIGYTARSKHTNRSDISYNTYYDYNGMATPVNHVSKYNATMSTPNKLYEKNKSYVSSVTVVNDSYVFEVYNYYGNIQLDSRYHYDGYAYADRDYALYSFLQKFIEQPEPEEFDVINVFTDTFNNPNFNKALGMGNRELSYPNTNINYFYHPYGMLPMTQADFKSITRYNHSTKAWDIEEEFFNVPDINYDNSAFTISCRLWIEDNLNTGNGGTSFRVFCNPNYKTRKIISFSNSGITIYATDTYWDISSYEMIPNLSVIPEELSQKRYYCVKKNSATWLYPNYDSNSIHYLIPRTQSKTYTGLITRGTFSNTSYFSSKPLASDEGGWILLSKTLIYPDTEDGPKSYQIYGPMQYDGSDWTFTHGRWATKDKILIGQDTYDKNTGRYAAITFRLYTVGDPYNPPTYQDIILPFTTKGTNNSYYCRYSWSNDGYLCAHYTSINEAIILNVYDPDNPLKIQNALYTHISNISNYIVYQCSNITNVTRFNIMNIDGEIIDTFELPDTQTYTVRGICGWKNNVYIEVSASSSGTLTYHYDTNTHILSVIDYHWNVFRRDSNFYRYTEESNDECYVLMINYSTNSSDYNGNPLVISSNDPLNPKYLLPTNLNWNNGSYKQYGWHGGMMFKIDNGKNLIFIAKTHDERVLLYDLGRRLDQADPIREVPFGFYPSDTSYVECGIYKDQVYYIVNSGAFNLYPVELWLAHNIKGTTKTITGVNNPFRLSGIKTNFGITNDISKVTSDNYDTSVNVVQ